MLCASGNEILHLLNAHSVPGPGQRTRRPDPLSSLTSNSYLFPKAWPAGAKVMRDGGGHLSQLTLPPS